MKGLFFVLCLVLIFSMLGCSNDVEPPVVRNGVWARLSEQLNNDPSTPAGFNTIRAGVTYGTVQTYTYFSNTTGANRSVNIFTPPYFDPSQTYPVLYLLHGIGGTHTEWMGGQPNEIISNLIADGMTVPMIMVMPNVRARQNDSASGDQISAENIAAFNNFINDLRDDLMPFIEANFPITHERSQTAIAGLSMGGRAALQIGVSMSEAFMYIGSFSTAPGVLGPGGLFQPGELTIPDEFINDTFILLNNGDNEQLFANVTMGVYNAFRANGVTPVHYVTPGGHDFSVWRNGLYHFARNIFHR